MKERTCNHCGASVYLAEPDERPEGRETPLDHFENEGHAWNSPITMACADCGNVWAYTGDADRPTCPNCKGKRTEPIDN